MKKHIIAATALIFTLVLSVQQIISNPTGAPSQASGGPAEGGATCTQSGCHFGTPTTVSNIITTDIPAEGYTPGTTYNITVTVTGSGWKGFMLSSQNASGSFLGTLMSGTGSKVVFTNYITHSSDKNPSPAVWTFKWKAPSAGSGAATFYGAFAVTRNATRTQSVTVQEKTAPTALVEVSNEFRATVYPNPVSDKLYLSYLLPQSGMVTISLLTIDGKLVKTISDGIHAAGKQDESYDIAGIERGIYFLKVNTPKGEQIQKIIIQ